MKNFLHLVFAFILFACTPETAKKTESIPNNPPINSKWNEIAELLSGSEISSNSSLAKYSNEGFYKAHSKIMNTSWDKIDTNYIQKVRAWSNENLPKTYRKNTAIYPLSGADFINLYHFAQDTNKYIMIGLETPGYLNDPINFSSAEINNSLRLIQLTLQQTAKQNYFSTNLMENKFKNKLFPGVAPILLVFLKRLGFTIDDFNRIQIKQDGKIGLISEADVSDKADALQGIKISFHSQGEEPSKRELIFLKMFVQEYSADLDRPEGKFFQSLGRINIVMKSAIYLMHMQKFQPFLEKMILNTDTVIEDDSGIPIKYFPLENWDIKGFGIYKSRIAIRYVSREANMFKTEKGNISTEQKNFTQPDLIKIFEENSKPLDFKYGYGGASFKTTRSNLILITRKEIKK